MSELQIEGLTIRTVRKLTKKELAYEGWDGHHPVMAIILSNGLKLYPSMDYEGNGGGAMFVYSPKDKKRFAL